MRAWWLVALGGCGRIDFAPLPDASTLSTDTPADTTALGDLVAHYLMESTPGQVLVDESGYGHDGACTACPTPIAGMRNGALQFDGIDDLITIASSSVLENLDTYTIAFWMQRDAPPSSGSGCLVSKRYGSLDGNTFQICDHSTNRLFFSSFNGGSNTEYYDTSGMLLDAAWHHAALTFDGTTERLFMDGTEHRAAATMKYWDAGIIVMGADIDNDTPVVQYEGLLDDVRIYRRVLDATELLQLATP